MASHLAAGLQQTINELVAASVTTIALAALVIAVVALVALDALTGWPTRLWRTDDE